MNGWDVMACHALFSLIIGFTVCCSINGVGAVRCKEWTRKGWAWDRASSGARSGHLGGMSGHKGRKYRAEGIERGPMEKTERKMGRGGVHFEMWEWVVNLGG